MTITIYYSVTFILGYYDNNMNILCLINVLIDAIIRIECFETSYLNIASVC